MKTKRTSIRIWLDRLWILLLVAVCVGCFAAGAWLGLRYTQCLLAYTMLN